MQSYIKYLEIPKAKDNPWKKDIYLKSALPLAASKKFLLLRYL